MRLLSTIAAISLALLAFGASVAAATTLQPIGDFKNPMYVSSDPGNPNRLFVVLREGRIEQVVNGTVSPFANLEGVVSCCNPERGLLSMALAPDFDESGRLYVFYTGKEEAPDPGEIHVAELTASGANALLSPLRNLLTIPHPVHGNHYGGQLQTSPDGDLFIATGDGGGNNDVHHNAQNLESLLGKILRIDPDPGGGDPYTVPADNPFAGAPKPGNTIWSYGLRNPYRFSFDRLNGNLIVADVGEGAREEIDFAPAPLLGAGANYGWNCREGLIAGPGDDLPPGECALGSFTEPVFDYPHEPDPDLAGDRCSIIGGYVARDASLGALYGRYVYSDYCSGVIRSLKLPLSASGQASGDSSLGLKVDNPVSFGEDSAGRLYVVEGGVEGRVSCLVGQLPTGCPVQAQPTPLPPVVQRPQPGPTFVGIKAQRRRVERGKVALLTVWVSPCGGRKGETVKLLRNGHANGTRFLSRACTARFMPRVRRGTTFAAATTSERGYLPGQSRRLTIRLAHKHHRH